MFFYLLKVFDEDILTSDKLWTLSGLKSFILIAINGESNLSFTCPLKQNLHAMIPFHCLLNMSAVQSC